jgi:hypothetical protein
MERLREATERAFGRLEDVSRALEQGENPDWGKLSLLQAVDIVQTGQAQILDALDLQQEHDNEQLRSLLG